MKINYENHGVAGLCLLPSYLVIAFYLADKSILIWVLGIAIMIIACSVLYELSVLRPLKAKIATWKRYWTFFVVQIFFWFLLIYIR